jgi:prepilin-type N-terminal cleavage/methylation domain-containing protein
MNRSYFVSSTISVTLLGKGLYMIPVHKNMRAQAGFTLVELAIVMIIIGLLIAGVLKGQALITNAKVTAQVAQFKAIDAATSTFKDMYASLPGDILAPSTRLPNCAAASVCGATPGNGNGIIDITPAIAPLATNEAGTYFVDLAVADLITGITGTGVVTAWGNLLPQGKLGGGLQPGGSTGLAADFTNLMNGATVPPTAGLYLTLTQTAGAVPANTITANQAQRLDTKIDDGNPGSGSVRGGGTVAGGAADCGTSATVWNEAISGTNCIVYVRIQG